LCTSIGPSHHLDESVVRIEEQSIPPMSTQRRGTEKDEGFLVQPSPPQLQLSSANSSNNNNNNDSSHENQNDPPHIGTTASTATWRKRGEQLRALVLEQDESNGAQTFVLSSSCPIQRYYQVADKVRLAYLYHTYGSVGCCCYCLDFPAYSSILTEHKHIGFLFLVFLLTTRYWNNSCTIRLIQGMN
jgi:hypothetical protein